MEHIREQGNPFPVIVISAHLDEEKVAELTRLGVSACLGKPFQFEELEILMKRALGDSPKAEIADPPPRKATRPAMSPPTPGLPSRVPDPPPDPPAPPPHGRRDRTGPRPRSRSRKKTNWKLYFAVTAVCAIGAGVFIFLEFMSSRVSQGIDQAMEQTVQKEANRQRQELQNLSEKDKEALRQSVGRK
jgi:FixJ family two-component response regulator